MSYTSRSLWSVRAASIHPTASHYYREGPSRRKKKTESNRNFVVPKSPECTHFRCFFSLSIDQWIGGHERLLCRVTEQLGVALAARHNCQPIRVLERRKPKVKPVVTIARVVPSPVPREPHARSAETQQAHTNTQIRLTLQRPKTGCCLSTNFSVPVSYCEPSAMARYPYQSQNTRGQHHEDNGRRRVLLVEDKTQKTRESNAKSCQAAYTSLGHACR